MSAVGHIAAVVYTETDHLVKTIPKVNHFGLHIGSNVHTPILYVKS